MKRIKILGQTAVYHCMSRVVGGEMLLGAKEKEILRKQLWQVAEFCGVEVLTYCIMSNHFHVLIRVRELVGVSDDELLRRCHNLYHHDKSRLEALGDILKKDDEQADDLRAGLIARMGDVSVFMKELKQRFSIWYNRSHNRFGTLWSERFKSVLLENKSTTMATVAAYIDLNPVRAGMVIDPKNYRYCGYAEAVVGGKRAQNGIKLINESVCIDYALEEYRMLLFGMGSVVSRESQRAIPEENVSEVINHGGKLPVSTVLRCRVRYMSDGAVLGSKEFVSDYYREHRKSFGAKRKKAFYVMRGSDWGGMVALRGLRVDLFG